MTLRSSTVQAVLCDLSQGEDWDLCLARHGIAEGDFLAACAGLSIDATRFVDSRLGIDGRIFGQAPVQAEGLVCGRRFYFRARSGCWQLTVEPPGVSHEPDHLDSGVITAAEIRGGEADGMGGLARGDIERILRKAIARFLEGATS